MHKCFLLLANIAVYTSCSNDDPCSDDGDHHYVCCGDGRCAPDVFAIVWMVPNNNFGCVLSL